MKKTSSSITTATMFLLPLDAQNQRAEQDGRGDGDKAPD
jgi:hypothetical protein